MAHVSVDHSFELKLECAKWVYRCTFPIRTLAKFKEVEIQRAIFAFSRIENACITRQNELGRAPEMYQCCRKYVSVTTNFHDVIYSGRKCTGQHVLGCLFCAEFISGVLNCFSSSTKLYQQKQLLLLESFSRDLLAESSRLFSGLLFLM